MENIAKQSGFLQYFKTPRATVWVIGLVNLLKVVGKLGAGGLVHSQVLIADGIHNLADFAEGLVIGLVIRVSGKPPTADYPFGRKNVETFTSLAIGVGLLYLAVQFIVKSLVGLLSLWPAADAGARALVSFLPTIEKVTTNNSTFPWLVAVTVGSFILSMLGSQYQIAVGKRSGHQVLVDAGKEMRSDSKIEMVTVFAVVGERVLHGTSIAYLAPVLEHGATLVVALMIMHTGWELFLKAWRVLLQHSIGHDEQLRNLCLGLAGVLDVRGLKTFQIGQLAVCKLDIVTRRGHEAYPHLEAGLRDRLQAYLAENEFPEAEIKVAFHAPERTWCRSAFAIVQEGVVRIVAPGLETATHLAICAWDGAEHDRITIDVLPQSLEARAALLVRHRVQTVYVFGDENRQTVDELSQNGISIEQAQSYLLPVMGLRFDN